LQPPKCANSKRKRRDLFNVSQESFVLLTPKINIIDLDDTAQGLEVEQLILNPSLSSKPLQYCLTVTRFACFIAGTTFLITTAITFIGASIINSNPQHITCAIRT
uniref:G_PROTEIN_RECEP_F1_2 domain-containing protein n=1 Tax=Elaeophora elaphi TaxID=1147741 RepID=A0A0R3RGH0_9BILA